MPIYEYQCKKCGTDSEFLIGVGQDQAELKCKNCGSPELEKMFSKTAIGKNNIIARQHGKTCCGRDERCDTPPCSGGACQR
ncbi:MAG: zinc ribbon domain-containing protein [Candidatus Latescibacteria bacterium]|nr:zinc ribbon domain-containing protein [Candidatus Latescibacterota bacterium]